MALMRYSFGAQRRQFVAVIRVNFGFLDRRTINLENNEFIAVLERDCS